jgi:oxygen-dependent protoporphyrinogen oxidase
MQGLAAAGLEGVLLGGNYVCGVALGKCVEHGYDFANQISSYVTSNAKVAA